MSYSIIGFGNIGHALAKAFARKGIEVSVATTRDPKSFASAAAAIGPTIIPKTLAEAIKADTVFLAVRFESHPDGDKGRKEIRRLIEPSEHHPAAHLEEKRAEWRRD